MKIANAHSIKKDTDKAVQEAINVLLQKLGNTPDFVTFHTSVLYDHEKIVTTIGKMLPETQVHGASSCCGVMTNEGFINNEGYGLGILGICDSDGVYGTAIERFDGNPGEAAKQALYNALNQADMEGIKPDLVWLSSSPGNEEVIINAIQNEIGTEIPIIGGSSADNTIEGKWQMFTKSKLFNNAVIISVLFPSKDFSYSFHSGYLPTNTKGIVTKSEGNTIYEIDGKPAANVYNKWTKGAITDELDSGGNILGKTTLFPLGRVASIIHGVPHYKLSHPEAVIKNKALTLFTEIKDGDEIFLMKGSKKGLIQRAGRVAASAVHSGFQDVDDISGCLIVYCAGCMLTVQDQMDKVVTNINESLENKEYLGIFTFGEQGCFVDGGNHHGNLMTSAIVFGK